jgi:hypothetical protein
MGGVPQIYQKPRWAACGCDSAEKGAAEVSQRSASRVSASHTYAGREGARD